MDVIRLRRRLPAALDAWCGTALRPTDPTPREITEAQAAGLTPDTYREWRAVATHGDACEAAMAAIGGPAEYNAIRAAGATHAEAVEALDYPRPKLYWQMRKTGLPACVAETIAWDGASEGTVARITRAGLPDEIAVVAAWIADRLEGATPVRTARYLDNLDRLGLELLLVEVIAWRRSWPDLITWTEAQLTLPAHQCEAATALLPTWDGAIDELLAAAGALAP